MTHEIVERSYVPLDDQLSPLPTRWSQADKCAGLEIQGSDGLEIKFAGVAKPQDDAAAVRADHPIPRECGIYYFEVTVLGKSKEGYGYLRAWCSNYVLTLHRKAYWGWFLWLQSLIEQTAWLGTGIMGISWG